MTGGGERPALDECGGDASGLTLAGVQNCRDVAARQLHAEEDGFQHRIGTVRKRAGARFAAGPRHDAVAQDEPLQEVHLVEADLQEEPRERRQRFLARIAPSVDIVPARRERRVEGDLFQGKATSMRHLSVNGSLPPRACARGSWRMMRRRPA